MNKTFKSVTANQIPYLGHQDCHITKTDTLKKNVVPLMMTTMTDLAAWYLE